MNALVTLQCIRNLHAKKLGELSFRRNYKCLTWNVRDYDIFGDIECRKNCKNHIVGTNVAPKPERNVQKNFFEHLSNF